MHAGKPIWLSSRLYACPCRMTLDLPIYILFPFMISPHAFGDPQFSFSSCSLSLLLFTTFLKIIMSSRVCGPRDWKRDRKAEATEDASEGRC
jgi:hypothetical protein